MKFKMLKAAFLGLALTVSGFANAALIIGDSYTDSTGKSWVYVGSWNLSDGPSWSETVGAGVMFTGLEAAQEVFGNLLAGFVYATSSVNTGSVDHLAWYDGWGWSQAYALAENFDVDINDDGAYTKTTLGSVWEPGLTDASAYISDHGFSATTYAFVGRAADVPEPSTLAILALGLIGLGARRFKK